MARIIPVGGGEVVISLTTKDNDPSAAVLHTYRDVYFGDDAAATLTAFLDAWRKGVDLTGVDADGLVLPGPTPIDCRAMDWPAIRRHLGAIHGLSRHPR